MRFEVVLRRAYQQEAFDKVREAIRQRKRRILIVSPTGRGKSVVASAMMCMAMENGKTEPDKVAAWVEEMARD